MSLTKATYSMIEGAPINVFDFMTKAQQQDVASGTGALDVTAALAAALNAAKAIPFSEKEMVFPAGLYRVTQFDFTGAGFCTFTALGTVQIYGNGTEDFVFGCDGYVTNDSDSTFTRSSKFIGGEWVIANTSGTYNHIVKVTAAVNCIFENFSISGNCGPASGANKIACAVNFSFVNRFIRFNVGTPGTPNAGFRSLNIGVGPASGNNFNNNVFESCRIQAGILLSPYTDTVGIYLAGGNANRISSCDISALAVGIEIGNERGLVAEANYHEFCTQNIVRAVSGNSRGNVFIGGIYEVASNSAAYNLQSTQNTTIIGGRYTGVSGGSSRVFVDQGTACFGLSIISPDLLNIDTPLTGTYRGASTVSDAQVMQVQWLSFPPNSVQSSDPNTLDDYEEGSWTPTKSTGTAFASASGYYTKTGNQVTATFSATFATETNASNAQITGFPFSATGVFSEQQGLAVGYNTSSTPVGGSLATATMSLRKVGVGGGVATITEMSGAVLSGSISYFTSS